MLLMCVQRNGTRVGCNSCKEVSLFSESVKVHERVLNERRMKIANESDFRKWI